MSSHGRPLFRSVSLAVVCMAATPLIAQVRWTFRGRLRPVGREVWRTGNWIGRIENGQIVEVWEATDV